jgi:hypothetical protein
MPHKTDLISYLHQTVNFALYNRLLKQIDIPYIPIEYVDNVKVYMSDNSVIKFEADDILMDVYNIQDPKLKSKYVKIESVKYMKAYVNIGKVCDVVEPIVDEFFATYFTSSNRYDD